MYFYLMPSNHEGSGCSSLDYSFEDGGDGTFSLLENTEPGTNLTVIVASRDDVTFEMTSEYLEIDPDTGNVAVKEGAVIDYEALLPSTFFSAEFR